MHVHQCFRLGFLYHTIQFPVTGLQVFPPASRADRQRVLHPQIIAEGSNLSQMRQDHFHLGTVIGKHFIDQDPDRFFFFREHSHCQFKTAQIQQPQIHKAMGESPGTIRRDLQIPHILFTLHRMSGHYGFHAFMDIAPHTSPLICMGTGMVGWGILKLIRRILKSTEKLRVSVCYFLKITAIFQPYGRKSGYGHRNSLRILIADRFCQQAGHICTPPSAKKAFVFSLMHLSFFTSG